MDLRVQKAFRILGGVNLLGLFDIYNLFNTNADQSADVQFRRRLAAADGDYRSSRRSLIGARVEW